LTVEAIEGRILLRVLFRVPSRFGHLGHHMLGVDVRNILG
jgi:hypothetical protein